MNDIEKSKVKFRARKNSRLRRWWSKHGNTVLKILLFYIYIPEMLYCKHKDKAYKALTWDPETCKKYLDKVVPFLVREDDPGEEILFTNADDMGGIEFYWSFSHLSKYRKYRKASRYLTKFNSQAKTYILEEYQIAGYQKMIIDNWILWNRAAEKFGWYSAPYNSDYKIGIVFYKENNETEK